MKKAKREKVARRKPVDGVRMPLYAAVHENKLGLWLAGGFVSPWPRGAAIDDHHAAACKLVLESGRPSAAALASARGALRYGSIAAVEIKAEHVGLEADRDKPVTVLPVQSIRTVAFASPGQATEFDARMSGYVDVPPGLIKVTVDPALFEGVRVDGSLDGEEASVAVPRAETIAGAASAGDQGDDAERLKDELDALDRLAGSLAATSWSVEYASEGIGRADMVTRLAGLSEALSASQAPVAIASLVDTGEEAPLTRPVIESLVQVVLSIPRGDVLSPMQVLDDLRTRLEAQGKLLPEIVARFLDVARSIATQQRDLGSNSYSDENGSITLRAILLFLMNPDPDRLDAVLDRNTNVGPRVFTVAASLVGFHAGFASIGGAPKSNIRRTLAIPSMALETSRQVAPSCKIENRFEESDGSRVTALSWRDTELISVSEKAHPLIGALATIMRKAGYPVSFSRETGDALLEKRPGTPDLVGRVVNSGPVFPVCPAVELSSESAFPGSRKQLGHVVADVQSRAAGAGVFAQEIIEGRSRKLRLSVFIVAPITEVAVTEAIASLRSASGRPELPATDKGSPGPAPPSSPSGDLFEST